MSYTFTKIIPGDFDEVIDKVINLASQEWFWLVSELNVQKTVELKTNYKMNKYIILWFCNPEYAYKAIELEKNIWTMLPCNILVFKTDKQIQISAIDPVSSMMAIENDELKKLAKQVWDKLENIIDKL